MIGMLIWHRKSYKLRLNLSNSNEEEKRMEKKELIVAIRAAKGITEPGPKKEKHAVAKKEKVVLSIAQLKQKVKELRTKREELLQQRNWKMSEILRKRVSRFT